MRQKILILAAMAGFFSVSGLRAENALDSLKTTAGGSGADEACSASPQPAASAPQGLIFPGWERVDNKASEGVKPQSAALTSDEATFWDKLNEDVFDDVCRRLKLRLKQDMDTTLDSLVDLTGGVTGRIQRKLSRYPDNTLASVDEFIVKINLGTSYIKPLESVANAGITGGVTIEGASVVIRPLGNSKSCKAMLNNFKVWDFKTIFPFKADRFAKMEVGELWKLPVKFWTGIVPGISAGTSVAFHVSFSLANERIPTISLYRVGPKELRMRLRLDQATVRTYSAGASYSVTPVVTTIDKVYDSLEGTLGTILGKAAARPATREFKDYTSANLGISHTDRGGMKVMLEFVLDPTNKEQMEALVRILRKGELNSLRELYKMAVSWKFLPGHNNIEDITELRRMQQDWQNNFGVQSSYAGANGYNREASAISLNLPVIVNWTSSHGNNYERIQSAQDGAPVLHANQAYRTRDSSFIDVPWLGKMFKHNDTHNGYVINKQTSDGKVSDPAIIYQNFEGKYRHPETSARAMVDEANSIMRLVGTRGEGTNQMTALPVEDIQPLTPSITIEYPDGTVLQRPSPTYKSAMMSFMITLNEKSVKDIIAAPADVIIKAYANSLEVAGNSMLRKILSVSTINPNGKIAYNLNELGKVIDLTMDQVADSGVTKVIDTVDGLCRTAALIVKDIFVVRGSGDWKERSAALSRILGGEGHSGLAYTDIMKVLVQLVSPKDIAGSFNYNTRKEVKGQKDVSATYTFNKNNAGSASASMDEFNAAKNRFNEPSQLMD